jgi:hypothetical protein
MYLEPGVTLEDRPFAFRPSPFALLFPLITLPDYKDSSASAKSSVIPAGMPESRAMDGNYIGHLCPI